MIRLGYSNESLGMGSGGLSSPCAWLAGRMWRLCAFAGTSVHVYGVCTGEGSGGEDRTFTVEYFTGWAL